jgi:integrase
MTDQEEIVGELEEHIADEFSEKIAAAVVDEMDDKFQQFSLKSCPLVEALEEFREEKLNEIKSTRQYNRKFDHMKDYLRNEVPYSSTSDLTIDDVRRYYNWRKYDSRDAEEPYADSTLSDDMYLFREFIRFMEGNQLVPRGYQDVVVIPDVDYQSGEGIDEKLLEPKIAKAAQDYLYKFHYADVEHICFALMCESGPRLSGLEGRDLSDLDFDEGVLSFNHHEETELKSNESSEREIKLYGELIDIIQDYLDNKRPEATDPEGRKPLLSKGNGRISDSTIRKIAYKWTRPCALGMECPHDRDPENCEAAQKNNSAYKCPSSRAPHHIRTGYITTQRNNGVSSEAIEQRCDVSPRVQDLHYDLPDASDERERYEDEFKDKSSGDSGFSH